jgi:hypothetical protein
VTSSRIHPHRDRDRDQLQGPDVRTGSLPAPGPPTVTGRVANRAAGEPETITLTQVSLNCMAAVTSDDRPSSTLSESHNSLSFPHMGPRITGILMSHVPGRSDGPARVPARGPGLLRPQRNSGRKESDKRDFIYLKA